MITSLYRLLTLYITYKSDVPLQLAQPTTLIMPQVTVQPPIARSTVLARAVHLVPHANALAVLDHEALLIVAFLLHCAGLPGKLLCYILCPLGLEQPGLY